MARVSISHSSRDTKPARQIKDWLERQGFDQLFLDFDKHAGIKLGSDWEQKLYLEVDWAEAVLLLVTPNWLASSWCFTEFTQARVHLLPTAIKFCHAVLHKSNARRTRNCRP